MCFLKLNDIVMACFLHVWRKLMTVCQVYPQYFKLSKTEVFLFFCNRGIHHPSEIFFSTTAKICWFSLQKKEIFILVIMCAQWIHMCICKTGVYYAKLCLLLEKSKIDHEGLVGKGTNGCRIGGWTQSSEVPAVRCQTRYSKTHWLSVKCRSKMLFSSFSYVDYLVREVSR